MADSFCLETQGASYDDGMLVLMCPVDEKFRIRNLDNWMYNTLTGIPTSVR